ncbi:AAA family ATPase [Fluviicola sp.]|jgi:exodeoxyribonuclease-5|uniref:ATP-dependent DNA helicase n=1 Tax=Fluviicola sp. TaxID=1917219 RepID=UPI00281E1D07|nr:AAA family ATPase [Fluviicola sp.]MDR0802486.1 AAA family ATPase [Fluviicola sp.]
MNSESFEDACYKLILSFFGHEPNEEQGLLIRHLANFTLDKENPSCFILKGYAGTGKTSILGAYIQALNVMKRRTVLMAPTGRAAKVLSLRSHMLVTTIHKRIYFTVSGPDGNVKLQLAPNKSKDTIFIVDEASMIGDYSLQSDGSVSRNLLEDVFQYTLSGENCKLILLGDEGQLPPVGSDESPALSMDYLNQHFPLVYFTVYGLTAVVRQRQDSGILENATRIRQAQIQGTIPKLDLHSFPDVKAVPGDELIEKIESSYSNCGMDEVMIVTRSNKRANLYNQHIRNRILMMEDELCGGDLLMVVKNNYFWLDSLSSAGFIANGELLKVHRIRKVEMLYDVRFAHLEVSMIDYPGLDRFEVIAFMETLTIEQPNLDRAFMKYLFFEIEKDYMHECNKQKRYQEIMKSPYFNALQIKFAYAVTCHKSQGGQWTSVFLDHGYLEPEQLDFSFLRWLYTAVTRASEQLYIVNLLEELVEMG